MSDFTIVDAAGNPVSYGRSASRPGSAVGRPAPNFARSSPLAGGATEPRLVAAIEARGVKRWSRGVSVGPGMVTPPWPAQTLARPPPPSLASPLCFLFFV